MEFTEKWIPFVLQSVKLLQHLVKSGRLNNVKNAQYKYVAKVHVTLAL
jgi:hypothetical protein